MEAAREMFFKMNINEKRKYYGCKDKYLTIDQIYTWPIYANLKNYETSSKKKISDFISEENYSYASKISIISCDITTLELDAIVNCTDESLMMGYLNHSDIILNSGEHLIKELEQAPKTERGCSYITSGYKLPATYVIHAVGLYSIENNQETIRNCYKSAFNCALRNNCRTIALPGIHGHASYALEAAKCALVHSFNKFDRIVFCLGHNVDMFEYIGMMKKYFPFNKKIQNIKSNDKSSKENQTLLKLDKHLIAMNFQLRLKI